MEVQSSFVIEGNIVKKSHEVGDLIIYELRDQETLYITYKSSGQVITRIDINCEMSQGTGFVDSLTYTDFE